jgi:hypothetical protein
MQNPHNASQCVICEGLYTLPKPTAACLVHRLLESTATALGHPLKMTTGAAAKLLPNERQAP